jgi:hypothetical protein
MASAHVLQTVSAPPIFGGAYFAVIPQSSAKIDRRIAAASAFAKRSELT